MPDRPTTIVVPLPTPDPFDWPAVRAYLASRAIPGLEHVEEARYRRGVVVRGHATLVEVRAAVDGTPLELALHDAPPENVGALTTLARRALSLDAPDHATAALVLGADRDLAPLLVARPHLRAPGTWDAFETGVRAIVGQQVSVAGATTVTARIVHRHGEPAPGIAGQAIAGHAITHAFPRPEVLAHGDLTGLGLTNARIATIRGFAAAVASGTIRLEHAGGPAHGGGLDELVASITAQPGLGPWTAHYVALRLGHADAFPASDLALRRALDPDDPPSARALERRAEAWRPWRALAAAHLWASDAARRTPRRPVGRPQGHEPTRPRGPRSV